MSDSPIDTPAQSMKVPWDKEDTEYLDTRDKAVTDLLAIRPLTLSPDGPVHYMQGGRWQRVHLDDLLSYSMGEKPEDGADYARNHAQPVLKAVAPAEPEVVPIDVKLVPKPEPAPLGTSAGPTYVGELADKPKTDEDTLLSAPNLLEVARRAYRCAGQARQKNGPGPARDMLYRLYTRLGDAAYAYQQDVLALKSGPLPLDIQPDLSKATNKAQDAVQFDRAELFYLGELLKQDACENGLHMNAHELWVAVSAVLVVS